MSVPESSTGNAVAQTLGRREVRAALWLALAGFMLLSLLSRKAGDSAWTQVGDGEIHNAGG
ncbi:DNA translocase FtsK 4TM domain-containing protein, partial [Acinetobacter baumannii]